MSRPFSSKEKQEYFERSLDQDRELQEYEPDRTSFRIEEAIQLLCNRGYQVLYGKTRIDAHETQNPQECSLSPTGEQCEELSLEQIMKEDFQRIIDEKNAMVIVLDHGYTILPPDQVQFGFGR